MESFSYGGSIMNTIGKILVILNFLFAIIVGFLLVVDIALRNRWKEDHQNIVDQAKVITAHGAANKVAMAKLLNDYKTKQEEIAKLEQKLYELDEQWKIKTADLNADVANLTNQLKDKDLIVTETRTAKERLVQEIAEQAKTIKEREVNIVRLEADVKKLRVEAVQFEALARTTKIQNENLLEQLREVTLALTREKAGVVSADVMVIRNPNEPNPPAVQVNGKIEKVDIDLVQLTLGTDHGVNKNHTLDVYRLTPEPKYLGMVRIVDANHHQSVARLIPQGNAAFRTPLRAGDLVTSKLTK